MHETTISFPSKPLSSSLLVIVVRTSTLRNTRSWFVLINCLCDMNRVFYRSETWPYSMYRFRVCCNSENKLVRWSQTRAIYRIQNIEFMLDNVIIEETRNSDCRYTTKETLRFKHLSFSGRKMYTYNKLKINLTKIIFNNICFYIGLGKNPCLSRKKLRAHWSQEYLLSSGAEFVFQVVM
jgi:hypothetical protein